MITVKINFQNKNLVKISLNGHADYDVIGKDLVCAGVSCCFLGSLNAIENKENIKYFYDKGIGEIEVINNLNQHDTIVLHVLVSQLEFISKNYPKNIKIIRKDE